MDLTKVDLMCQVESLRVGWQACEAERDTLRQQLSAAVERAERAESELKDALEASGKNWAAYLEEQANSTAMRTHLKAEITLTEQQRDTIRARAEASEAACMEVEKIVCPDSQMPLVNPGQYAAKVVAFNVGAYKRVVDRQLKDAEAAVAGLRSEFEHIERAAKGLDECASSALRELGLQLRLRCKSALAATPAQHAARIRGKALREAAEVYERRQLVPGPPWDKEAAYGTIAIELRAMADEAAKEAQG